MRAIIGCRKYVVTGIGHHRDHVLADDVADYVAATPTAAAVYVAERAMKSREALEGRELATNEQARRYMQAVIALLAFATGLLALLGYLMLQNV